MKGCIALVLFPLTLGLFLILIWYVDFFFDKKSFEGKYIYINKDPTSFLSNAILEIKPNNDFVYDFTSNEAPKKVGYCLGTWNFSPESFLNAVDYTFTNVTKTHLAFYKDSFPVYHSKHNFNRISEDSISSYFSGDWFFKHKTRDTLSVTFHFIENEDLKYIDLVFLRE